MTHFVAKISKFVNYFTICLFSSSLYHNLKTKIPCTPFATKPSGNGHLSGVHTLQKVCTPLTPHYQKKEFNFRIVEQSFAYRRTIVWVGANNRLGVRKRLLPCLPFPVKTASIPCADGFQPPIDPI
jgi:hypothetical protein